jgi:hypothetical protein
VDTSLPVKPGYDDHFPRQAPAIAKGQEVWMEVILDYDVSGRKFKAWVDVYETVTESLDSNNTIFGIF